MNNNRRLVALAALAACLAAAPAAGAGFPERPVRMVAASAAGGGTDIIARLLAHKLTDLWSQQVIVDNRPGGGGVIATDITAKAVPDGYTLLLQSVGISYAPALYKKLPFDVRRDISAVTIVGTQPFVLAVHPSLPAKSVAELVQLAKSKPGDIRFASGGVSGASHLGSELFRVTAGVNMVHVPYKGTGPGTTALLTGEVQMAIAGVGTLLPHAKSGKVRALAVTGAKRSPAAPELPTVAENGLPGYAFDVWYGVFASSKTPRATLDKINADAGAALRDAETAKRFAGSGIDLIGGSVEESNRYLRAEMAKWTKVIREAGISAD
ncbi:MAG: tripartite tricarboxylate transporter substrate binding protein [Burkholderiales bacterium]|nr:tripartite tricarboxylate transporter substrate binding protein [Burkholderiales bacterium]MCW5603070.1 tripartite tricarboxylate transporter substrate binding protein [Burkholderiales bacterium]